MKADEIEKLAQRLARIISASNEELLTAKELAAFLKVSENYVRVHKDMFPHIKIGGNVRFPKSKVLDSLMG